MIVVGLSGYAGAGKDAVADILVSDYGFTKMAFAEPLKRMLRNLDPIIGHELYAGCCNECSDVPEVTEVRFSDAAKFGFNDQSLKHSPWAEEVRDLWQKFGTEVFREEDEDYWVRLAVSAIHESPSDRIVFTDVRFENEADMIYDLRGEDEFVPADARPQSSVWRIARPGLASYDVHPSEQMVGLLGEEVTILNIGTLEDLEEPVSIAMSMLMDGTLPGLMNLDQLARDMGLGRRNQVNIIENTSVVLNEFSEGSVCMIHDEAGKPVNVAFRVKDLDGVVGWALAGKAKAYTSETLAKTLVVNGWTWNEMELGW